MSIQTIFRNESVHFCFREEEIYSSFDVIRVFDLAADINSGAIFFLLPMNVIYTAFGAFNIEHVNICVF